MSRKKLFFLLGIALTLVGYIFSYFQNKQISQISPIFQVSPNPSKILSEVEGQTSPISLITPIPSVFTIAKVTRVYDGDTIQIEGGQKVRYAGIDTPEVYPTVLCYSEEAKAENEKLVLGQTVELEKDISETDKYGRLLRYVHLGGVLVNDEMLREGFASVSTYPPDVKYQKMFLKTKN